MRADELMAAAAPDAIRLVAGVRAEQWDAPTPCAEWDVRALVNHLLLWSGEVNARAATRQPVPESLHDKDFTAADDYAERFAAALGTAVTGWAEPGALDGATSMGRAEMPAEVVARMLFGELVLHGWDLARATGQDFAPSDDQATAALAVVRLFEEQGREHGVYAAERDPADDASPLDVALAASGRDPGW